METNWPASADGFELDADIAGTPNDLLSRSRELYSAFVRAGALILWRADMAGRMTAVTGWQAVTGRPDHEALGRGYLERFHPEDRHLLDFRNREIGDTVQAECRLLDKHGRWRWVRGRGVLIAASRGFPSEWVGTLEDIHDQRLALERARYLAERDALTGLGNRRTLIDQLIRLRGKEATATVVMLDVNRFKEINELHGHQTGDRFLVRLGQLLVAAAPPHSVCARMGGDEFCVVVADATEAEAFCARLDATRLTGVSIADLQIPFGFTAGIANAAWDVPDPVSTVLRHADLALFAARSAGRAVAHFEPAMQEEADARQQLSGLIALACRNDEFFLEYQPIIAIDSGETVSFEALVRWQHPQMGRIQPAVFVPLAEQNGTIAQLGRWVLSKACADLAAADPRLRINLNVSARQLLEPGFADAARDIARAHGVDPQRITLELTESSNMAAVATSPELTRLRSHGFRTALDDFGTEYAVLSHVSSGQFDAIKLSREFIVGCCCEDRARTVLRHVINLCDDLGMDVVAEGIETRDEFDCLRAAGVRLMQGFHFDRPGRLRARA